MDLQPKDIIVEFLKYSEDHPLRILTEQFYSPEGLPVANKIAEGWWAIDTIQAVARPLFLLSGISEKAYLDFVRNKIKAKDKKSYNVHGLISALTELSITNTFLVRSDQRESFVYEDRRRDGSSKNVEFSIKTGKFTFHVEVKTSNLFMEDNEIGKLLETDPCVLNLDARTDEYEEIVRHSIVPVRGSLDRRISDFLKSADEKFSKTEDPDEINLLVITWDERIKQPIMALKRKSAEGLLTAASYERDKTGAPRKYDNIDCILVNGNYAWFKEYVSMLMFQQHFTPEFPIDPFFQVFCENVIIDHNMNEERRDIIRSIIQQKAPVVDEKYAESLAPYSIAWLTGSRTIKFEDLYTLPFNLK